MTDFAAAAAPFRPTRPIAVYSPAQKAICLFTADMGKEIQIPLAADSDIPAILAFIEDIQISMLIYLGQHPAQQQEWTPPA